MQRSKITRNLLAIYAIGVLLVLYMPLFATTLASISEHRYFSFPFSAFSTRWYEKMVDSLTVAELIKTSLTVAAMVTIITVVVGFFAALAFARYDWKGRKLFQKIIILPIFFPQTVLGLALLIWFTFLGITPSWKTAVVAHAIWITPITTLIMAIQAYSLDPSLEEAASDLGASRRMILWRISLPLMLPSMISAALFAFLMSWGNFALSMYTDGADVTMPEWLYAKMVGGYSPLIPAMGTFSVIAAGITTLLFFFAVKFMKPKEKIYE
ncbi:ABC transporter permease [Halothiobacillus sp.]|uniref:ABC transporter permease n=1 Tax=Halothiobacillus sp. TaxID=1891311 RepID=UPI00260BF1C8|nr:ABC transporter permease [Halothiobacillus sp.]